VSFIEYCMPKVNSSTDEINQSLVRFSTFKSYILSCLGANIGDVVQVLESESHIGRHCLSCAMTSNDKSGSICI
jgi:hypothetical protein